MEKLMRNAPSFAVLIVMIIQVDRVSAFGGRIGAGMLSWVFAIFLAFVIYVLSYWNGRTSFEVTAKENNPDERREYLKQKKLEIVYGNAHWVSGIWLFLFILIEGSLNLSETMANLPGGTSDWEYLGAIVYGAFPTLAAYGLGSMQALIDRVPVENSKKSSIQMLFERWIKIVETKLEAESSSESSEKLSESEKKVSENFPNDWRKVLPYLLAPEILEISKMSTADIKAKYHLKTAKTAQNWRGYAQAEVQKMESVK